MTKFYREATLRIRLRKENFSGYLPDPIHIRGLRVSFSLIKSLAWSTNSGVIRIWNLNQSHRNLLKDYGDEVTLYAGYRLETGPQVLYIGDTTAISHVYEQPEIVTILECGDGEKFLNQLRVSVSYASGTSARQIIKDIASQMGIALIEFADSDDLIYRQGYSFTGMGKDALVEVCDTLGLQPSVQDNMLQIIPKNGTIVQQPIIVNENTGMQGIPQRFTYKRLDLWRPVANKLNILSSSVVKASDSPSIPISQPVGYKVNIALNPLVLPGARIILSSTHLGFRGEFRIDNVRHEGDTYGLIWSSNLEVTEVIANGVNP